MVLFIREFRFTILPLLSFLSDLVFANKVLLVSMLGKLFCEAKRGFLFVFDKAEEYVLYYDT